MFMDKKIAVIIAAAGEGARMGGPVPKQFLKIGGKAMFIKTAEAFRRNSHIDYIIIAANERYLSEYNTLLADSGINAILAAGGKKRQDSVAEGLKKLPEDADYVLIHDAARPFITGELIDKTIASVIEKKAVVCAVPVKDTIRVIKDGGGSFTPDRGEFYSAQTPQAFEKALILDAYEKAASEGFYGTDDAALAERAGYHVHIISGSYDNIKITTEGDLPVKINIRTGTGFDVHAFESGRRLVLGGVTIPFEKGLSGHSDADVLLHAVIDALLGAAGCGDIGRHFPDSDEKYKDISSLLLLEKTADIIKEKGFSVGNIDVTLIAEKPKIAPYAGGIKANIAKALGLSEERVNIKGKTTEGLGFVGREEGIAAQAACLLYLE